MRKGLPLISDLHKLLRYEPETGKFFWRERGVSFFRDGKYSAEHACAVWNARYSGMEAFTTSKTRGYLHGRIFSRMYLAHRVAWAIHFGEWPENQIDHINGITSDNRIANLREVNNAENSRNAKRPKNNKSGVCGVFWCKQSGKWRATIVSGRKSIHLGRFHSLRDAVSARREAEIKHGYHKNHGRA